MTAITAPSRPRKRAKRVAWNGRLRCLSQAGFGAFV